MTKNMTEGSPMKLILGFSIPMLFGMLFQQFYNLVDTMIVGKTLGVDALAGVGATSSINFMIIGFCVFIRISIAFLYISICGFCFIASSIIFTIFIGKYNSICSIFITFLSKRHCLSKKRKHKYFFSIICFLFLFRTFLF